MLSILTPTTYNKGYAHMELFKYLNLNFPQWLWAPNQQNKSHYSKGCTILSSIYEEAFQAYGWHIDLTTYDIDT